MRALVFLALVGTAAPAFAEDSFEAAAQNAQRIGRIDDLVWALTATCESGNDIQQRQCRQVRNTRAKQLAGATLLVEGDRDAFTVGTWNAQKKSATVTLSSCIRCGGVDVEGKSWFVSGSRPANDPVRFAAGKLVAPSLSDSSRTFPDDASTKKYAAAYATAKVQFLVKVPASFKWSESTRQGITLDVVGYRVYSPCDGSVVISSPASGPGDVDKKACAGIPEGGEVDELTPAMIRETLKPVLDGAKDCQEKHGDGGSGKVRLSIGPDGKVQSTELQGGLANTETGKCIDSMVKKTAFPRSKKPKTQCAVPIALPQ
jgi:hypothetical protein